MFGEQTFAQLRTGFRNTIIDNLPCLSLSVSPPSVHPTPLQTHTTVAAYIVAGDNMWRWVTIYAVKPDIYFRRREYMPYDICPATKYAATRTASWR